MFDLVIKAEDNKCSLYSHFKLSTGFLTATQSVTGGGYCIEVI